VAADVAEGLVSPTAAEREYGVRVTLRGHLIGAAGPKGDDGCED
jgi:hypothetical protein